MKLIILILLLSLTSNILANEDGEYSFIHGKTQVKNPYDVRDPFKRKVSNRQKSLKSKDIKKGIFDNSSSSIEDKYSDSIKIVGVMIGKERRAMAKVIGGNETFIVKEGMKIGQHGAEVKAILPGGVVLVEKIRNVYDQEEYLETVLPVTGN